MTNPPLRFRAPLGPGVLVATIAVCLMLLGGIALTAFRLPLLGVLLVVVLVLSAVLAPRAYLIERSRLTIERGWLPIQLPLSDIKDARLMERTELRGSIRTLASGGLFGIYGRFWSRSLGHFRMYARRADGFVLIDAGTRYVVSPESPAEFVAALNSLRIGVEPYRARLERR